VLPDGKVAPGAVFGGQAGFEPDFAHDISMDGSRVFWSDGAVYVRENGSNTVPVSQGPASFWDASPDGRYAFYTEAGELWRFDVENQTRLEIAGSSGGVQGVLGVNETGGDGAYVYFVSQEALAGLHNGAGQPVEGQDNLYVYEPDPAAAGSSRIEFIGSLSSQDSNDWESLLGARTANVTPDGHALAFVAHENLTAGAYPGEGSEEIYVYDTRDDSLFCASCSPQASGGYILPAPNAVYAYRHISADGDRVFFDSNAPLVAQDVNGAQDVYEWERDGSESCHEAGGCVYLLSDGIEHSAWFLDASANGNDVFMVTRQRLTPQDGNETSDVYDARVDGIQPVAPPQCSGTGCQGAPAAAPIFATPASVTYNGMGNFLPSVKVAGKSSAKGLARAQKLARALSACKHERQKKKRRRCESQARKTHRVTARRSATQTSRRAK
jgi:hypothetical protein